MRVKNLTYGAFYLALGVLLPMAFHMAGWGTAFLPMHLPVLMAGFHLGPLPGLLCGALCPLLSHVLTGMPPVFPSLAVMLVELPLYGFLAGLLYKTLKLNLWLALFGAVILGKIGLGLWVFILAHWLHFNLQPWIYLQAALVTGLPGIMLQIIIMPVMVRTLLRDQ